MDSKCAAAGSRLGLHALSLSMKINSVTGLLPELASIVTKLDVRIIADRDENDSPKIQFEGEIFQVCRSYAYKHDQMLTIVTHDYLGGHDGGLRDIQLGDAVASLEDHDGQIWHIFTIPRPPGFSVQRQ